MNVRRVYETTIIVNAALEDQDVEALITKINNYIENHGGEVYEVQRWGRRRLAYPINKKYNGYYIHIEFRAMSNVIPVIERFLVLEDTVLRHLTLQLSDELREFRNRRSMEEGKPVSIPDVIEKEATNLNVVEEINYIKEDELASVGDDIAKTNINHDDIITEV